MNMRRMKKMLSLLTAVIMVFSMLQLTASAEKLSFASQLEAMANEGTDKITFNGESESALGAGGTPGRALGSEAGSGQIKLSDAGGPVITREPEDVVVSYPEGAKFSVEVADPAGVASYQWYMLDQEDQLFFLEGSSAHTNTLVVPSTQRLNAVLRFFCEITGTDGLVSVTREASLDMDNREENKPVFYVCEYAIEPGESIDLSTVDIGDGYKLGSGKVTFDSNASDITIENLDFDNSHTMCGLITAPNVGLDFEYRDPDQSEYNVIFVGENRILNTYYNYDYNVGGIPFDFYILGEGEKPLINFIGDGTLSITNGYNALRVIGDLMIGIDITVKQNRREYADGIAATNILVAEGTKLDLTVNGYAFNATGNLFMKDAEVKALANIPHISQGAVTKNIFTARGAMSLENTKLDVTVVSDQDLCGTTAGNVVFLSLGEMFITKGSTVNCDLQFIGDDYFAGYFTGMDAQSGYVEDSTVSITADSKNCIGLIGVSCEEYFEFIRSALNVDIHASGSVYGISSDGDFGADDSNVDVRVSSYPGFILNDCCGLVCENAVFRATDPKYTMTFAAPNGIALACDLGRELSDTPVGYDAGYEAKNVYLRDGTACIAPKENVISLGSLNINTPDDPQYTILETVYDAKNTAKPAEKVSFGLGSGLGFVDVARGDWCYDAVSWAAKNQITLGTDATHFSPVMSTNRAQAVTFLWRAAGCPVVNGVIPFDDVKSGAYYEEAVRWAYSEGITKGKTETAFGPGETVTRQQFAAFLYRYAQTKGEGFTGAWYFLLNFQDASDVSSWADEAIHWCVMKGILQGNSANRLNPGGDVSRAAAVAMLFRYFGA